MLMLQIPIGTGRLEGIGPLGQIGNTATEVFGEFNTTISTTLGVLTVSAGLWFIFQIFGGALQWLSSGGEKQALQNAQKRIANAIIGLFMVIFAYTLIALIGRIFGLNIFSPLDAILGNPPPSIPVPPPPGPGPVPPKR